MSCCLIWSFHASSLCALQAEVAVRRLLSTHVKPEQCSQYSESRCGGLASYEQQAMEQALHVQPESSFPVP